MGEHLRDQERLNAAAANTASHAVHEPMVLTDDGIRQWAEEQEQYAKGVADSDPRHGEAVLILCYVRNICTRLAHPAPDELRQRVDKRAQEILRELRAEWHDRKPSAEPPMDLLRANAQRQAYWEIRGEVMSLVQRIIALRRADPATNGAQRVHHRPVKRIR